ncbi:hypothetical protein CCACVL1_01512 [Corchorus capsularis]|uniref:Uncharacterized protein n=1 Tax=Corchorus capsularis TaxID=210143 RepID=A0A1R3KHL3_COCAP|nr:hypothetical protein CCACVL1_01512 [Corchorus capsularis]
MANGPSIYVFLSFARFNRDIRSDIFNI